MCYVRYLLQNQSKEEATHQDGNSLYSYVCKQNGHREHPTAEVRQKISPSPGLAGRTKRAWNRSMWATERFLAASLEPGCAVCPSQSTVRSSTALCCLLCFRAVHLLTAPRTQAPGPTHATVPQCHCQHRSVRTCRSGDPGLARVGR